MPFQDIMLPESTISRGAKLFMWIAMIAIIVFAGISVITDNWTDYVRPIFGTLIAMLAVYLIAKDNTYDERLSQYDNANA